MNKINRITYHKNYIDITLDVFCFEDEDGEEFEFVSFNSGIYIYYESELLTGYKVGDFVKELKRPGDKILLYVFLESPLFDVLDKFYGEKLREQGLINPFIDYQDYLESDEWKETRNERLRIDKRACRLCGSTKRLQVHHLNYTHLNEHEINDTITLCASCHEFIHTEE